jgi:drug/metabolite transporter (DMT)-like permease
VPARPSSLPLLAALVTVLLWASAFVVIRDVGAVLSPGPLALLRLAIAAVALSGVRLLPHRGPARVRPSRRTLLLIGAYGVAWFGLYNIGINATERHLDAGTTALIVNVAPVLVAVLAALFLGEGFPPALRIGLPVAFAGVAVIAIATSSGRSDAIGVLLAVGCAVSYAVGVLLQKIVLRSVDALTATWLGCVVGAVTCLPFAGQLVGELAVAPPTAVAGVVYLALGPTALAFTTWAYALARTSAGTLSASTYVVPALTVLLSAVVLGEVPPPVALAGGALCLVGVAITRVPLRGRRRPRPTASRAPVPVPHSEGSTS